MTVKAILSRKGNDVLTVSPIATLFEAVNILDAHRIGAVVIAGADPPHPRHPVGTRYRANTRA